VKYFTIRKDVSLEAHWITIFPVRGLSYDEKTHYIILLADILRALKWRHIFKYFSIRINDNVFRHIWMVSPFEIDLMLPINKDVSLLDELVQKAIERAESVLDNEQREKKEQLLMLYKLQESRRSLRSV